MSLATGPPLYGKPRPAMTGKYRMRNLALVAGLALLDFLGKLHKQRQSRLPTDRPVRVLIINWAHLGDVVVMLPMLKFLANHPRVAGVGVLIGSCSQPVLSGCSFIDKVHCLDHFLLDRRAISRIEKVRQYFVRQRAVVEEIRSSSYDISVDLFSVFPSTHRLSWKAGIPTRVGFDSAGLGTYLTHPYPWTMGDEHILIKQLRLLEPILGGDTPKTMPASYPNFVPSVSAQTPLKQNRGYVLMHIGSGDFRSWPLANWLSLGRELQGRGEDLVFTGAEGREADIAGYVAEQLAAQCVAGLLSWNEFVTSVANAAVVISVDTVTGHLAACFGVPSIILLSGRWGRKLFRPNSPKAATVSFPVGCAPCWRSAGCESMACVKNISVNDVLRLFDQVDIR